MRKDVGTQTSLYWSKDSRGVFIMKTEYAAEKKKILVIAQRGKWT